MRVLCLPLLALFLLHHLTLFLYLIHFLYLNVRFLYLFPLLLLCLGVILMQVAGLPALLYCLLQYLILFLYLIHLLHLNENSLFHLILHYCFLCHFLLLCLGVILVQVAGLLEPISFDLLRLRKSFQNLIHHLQMNDNFFLPANPQCYFHHLHLPLLHFYFGEAVE